MSSSMLVGAAVIGIVGVAFLLWRLADEDRPPIRVKNGSFEFDHDRRWNGRWTASTTQRYQSRTVLGKPVIGFHVKAAGQLPSQGIDGTALTFTFRDFTARPPLPDAPTYTFTLTLMPSGNRDAVLDLPAGFTLLEKGGTVTMKSATHPDLQLLSVANSAVPPDEIAIRIPDPTVHVPVHIMITQKHHKR